MVKVMWGSPFWVSQEVGVVGNISHCFKHGTEGWRRLHPAHSAGHRDCHTGLFVGVTREDNGQMETVSCSEEHVVEPIFDVVFSQVHWATVGMCMSG